MSIAILPIDADAAAYTVDVSLSGSIYRLHVKWNTRAANWSLGIGLTDGTMIAAALILPDWQLFRQINDERMPPGRLIAIDQSGAGEPPSRFDLGSRVVVVYDDGL